MSVKKYFGTDGIRGKANKEPISPVTVMKIGQAAGAVFKKGSKTERVKVIVGKDTRLSGYMLEDAIVSGLISVGVDVILLGPMPTPSVAMLIKGMKANGGIMITASHNLFEDNGIKIFGPDGHKIPDDQELEVESLIEDTDTLLCPGDKIGKAVRLNDAQGRYIELIKHTYPADQTLDGIKIVLDCANGATYKVAPTILKELGAEVIAIAVEPDGKNINRECGATHPETMCRAVIENKADIGIALDGDGDRIFMCDEKGREINPDVIIGLLVKYWHEEGKLKKNIVVGTMVSNMGLEKYMKSLGLEFRRTKVGERYVVEEMKKTGANIGGESSGHIVLSDYACGGDGLMIALQVLAIMKKEGKKASEYLVQIPQIPQKIAYVYLESNAKARTVAESDIMKKAKEKIEAGFKEKGRIIIRPSGTAPAVMLMVAHENEKTVGETVATLETMVKGL